MNNKNLKISSNRSFGFVFAIVFLIIGFWDIKNLENIRYWSIVVAVIFFLLGLLDSKLLLPFNKIWFKFGIILGNIVSPVVMGIIFFLVVTPIGIFMRLLGKDLIGLKKHKKDTYWIAKDIQKSSMKNQF